MGDSEYLSGFYNVELHHHLYGSVRKETIKDVARSRDIPFDETKFDEAIKNCHTLQVFVKIFDLFLPVIQGDTKVIERIAYEAVVDQYNNKVAYFETRDAKISNTFSCQNFVVLRLKLVAEKQINEHQR